MYTSYYGMATNPFLKEGTTKYKFESNDFRQVNNRLHYIKEIKGIALITGSTGFGKTYAIRYFINELNKGLYKIIYISITNDMTNFDFYKVLCNNLKLDIGACYRTDIYKKIQDEFKRLVTKDRVQPIIILDDIHLIRKEIFDNFKIFYDFDMDSCDYVSLILVGKPEIKDELCKNIYEGIKQRIIVNYTFEGLSRQEVKSYIESRLKIAESSEKIFTDDGITALYSCSKSSPRTLNTLITNSLMLGFQKKSLKIDSEIVMSAKQEMDLSK